MIKYIICYKDIVICKGESNYYDDFTKFIPLNYQYVWTFTSQNLILINVEPRRAFQDKKIVTTGITPMVDITTWERDKFNPYRMETG